MYIQCGFGDELIQIGYTLNENILAWNVIEHYDMNYIVFARSYSIDTGDIDRKIYIDDLPS